MIIIILKINNRLEKGFEKKALRMQAPYWLQKKFETEFPAKENSLLEALFLAIVWEHPDVRGEGGGLHRRRVPKITFPRNTRVLRREKNREHTKENGRHFVCNAILGEAIITLWKSRTRLHPACSWSLFEREATEK